MIKKLASALGLASILLSASAQALPIVQADAFTAGDNKAALETSTGLVWMDFGVNQHQTYSEIGASLHTTYSGWRFATISEIDHLWTSLFEDLPEWNRIDQNAGFLTTTEHDDYFNSITEVFGVTWYDGVRSNTDEFGNVDSWLNKTLFAPFSDGVSVSGLIYLFIPYDDIHPNEVYYWVIPGYDVTYPEGALLVKDTSVSVPEPTSLMLLILGILTLVVRKAGLRR